MVKPRPSRFTPRKDPVPTAQEARWAPGPVWTGAKYLVPTAIRYPDRPTRSESLYLLSYPGSPQFSSGFQNCAMLIILSQKLLRNQVEAVANHEDENVRIIRQGKP